MASYSLVIHILLHLMYAPKAQTNFTATTTALPITTAEYFTTESRDTFCSSNYAFVYIESSSSTLVETVLSERTSYPPYAYNRSIVNTQVSLYANNGIISESVNNPCDTATWNTPPSYYDNTIVLIHYIQSYALLCSPQQWTLNLQQYANTKAVLIGNNNEIPAVYPLSGEHDLDNPVIPTRMIAKTAASKIVNTITNTSQDVFATIDCYNDTAHHPVIICMLDSSVIPNEVNMIVDGEYQEQANILVNDHPVWLKEGHRDYPDFYIWLTINHSTTSHPWRWVIGTDYNDRSTIDLECIQNTTDTNYIDDPSLCDNNWYRNGTRIHNISSHGGICNAGDVFVCAEAASAYFTASFAGRYRQLHKNTQYYVSETAQKHTVLKVILNLMGFMQLWWVFDAGLGPEAACQITEQEMLWKPWKCNAAWRVWNPSLGFFGSYEWTNQFDIDECSHPNITVNDTIVYPKRLCVRDPTQSTTTFYHSFHGIYYLDETQTFDDRFVYKNQRLNTSSVHDFYFIFVDEYDSWVINEQVPPVHVPTVIHGICDENVQTPDLCTNCWYFMSAFEDATQCNIDVFAINDTTTESECIGRDIPMNNIIDYTQEITACFDDGSTGVYDHPLTGTYMLEHNTTYNDRAVWSMTSKDGDVYYAYYSERWKYWVIDTAFKEPMPAAWSMICLVWEIYEPWNCSQWYSQTEFSITMSTQCTLPPTTDPTVNPTPSPTHCPTRQMYIDLESVNGLNPSITGTIDSTFVHFPPFSSGEFIAENVTVFEDNRAMTLTQSNPCDTSTWSQPSAYYQDTVVMISYSDLVATWCNVQQWVLNVESYAYNNVRAVLIGNNKDGSYVYPLNGDDSLPEPAIPTRMISQSDAATIRNAEAANNTNEIGVLVTFGCFMEMEYPPMICMTDGSLDGINVHLIGEYQELSSITKNDHPVWRKKGTTGLWDHLYMFLYVDTSWKWIISGDYNDEAVNIIAWCTATNGNDVYLTHPALCDDQWTATGMAHNNLTSTNSSCELTDHYICVQASPSSTIESLMGGTYRQSHEGVALWFGNANAQFEPYVTARHFALPPMEEDNAWAFVLTHNNDTWAYCVIGDGNQPPTEEERLSPWKCTDWYVYEYNWESFTYEWVNTLESLQLWLDIEECDANGEELEQDVHYDDVLCLMHTYSDTHYSHYQGLFGVYLLDESRSFDDKPMYYQQRLQGNSQGNWYILYYDEIDAWVINDDIPSDPFGTVQFYKSICDYDDVGKPNDCPQSWHFYRGYTDSTNVTLTAVDSNNEDACVPQPEHDPDTHAFTQSIELCLDKQSLSGEYTLGDTLYNDRHFWLKDDSQGTLYLYYDEPKRFWVIGDTLGDSYALYSVSTLHAYCLLWDAVEPFDCDEWYRHDPDESIHKVDCLYVLSTTGESSEESSEKAGAKSDDGWVGWVVGSLLLLCCVGSIVYYMHPARRSRRESTMAFKSRDEMADEVQMPTFASHGTDEGVNRFDVRPESMREDSLKQLKSEGTDVTETDQGTTAGGEPVEKKKKRKKKKKKARTEEKDVATDATMVNWESFDDDEEDSGGIDFALPVTTTAGDTFGAENTRKLTTGATPGAGKGDPFDEENARKLTIAVGTIGDDLNDNPFLGNTTDGDDPEIEDSDEQRANWFKFDET
eukprot:429531_1